MENHIGNSVLEMRELITGELSDMTMEWILCLLLVDCRVGSLNVEEKKLRYKLFIKITLV